MLGAILSDKDLQILDAVTRLDVDAEDMANNTDSVKITLTFKENEFVSNKTLSKTVVSVKPEDDDEEEEASFQVSSDEIQWKEGHGPAAAGNKGKKREAEEEGSFFDLFDAKQYDDDTLMEPLREAFIEAADLYQESLDPEAMAMRCGEGGCCEGGEDY